MSLPGGTIKAGTVGTAAGAGVVGGTDAGYGARAGSVNGAAAAASARRSIHAVRLGITPPFVAVAGEAPAEGAGEGDADFGFQSLTDENKSLYRTNRFYEFIQHLSTDERGNKIPLEILEKQMAIDVPRSRISVNGQLPEAENWTKETLITKIQSILGDGWERWKAVMYEPFCVAISQTIMAKGMEHFQKRLLIGNYLLSSPSSYTSASGGAGGNGRGTLAHLSKLTIDPSSGAVDFIWTIDNIIFNSDNVELIIVSTNKFSAHVGFAPSTSGEKPYTGSIVYSMDQTELFNNIMNKFDTILNRIMTLVVEKATKPSAELTHFFERLADRVISIARIRARFPVPNTELIRSVYSILTPYFKESRESTHIYDISPRCDDYINYLMLVNNTIRFINSTNPVLRQFKQFAQNVEGTFHVHEILEQMPVYILLHVGFIPVLRIRSSPSISFYTANERYKMEQNAKRTGGSALQPTYTHVTGTAETLPKGMATIGRALGWLGGGIKTKIAKNRRRKNRTIKRRKIRR